MQVFKVLLTQDKEVVQMPVNKPTRDYHRLPVDTRVFAVDSRVKEEAEQVFYRTNTFCVDANDLLPLFILRLAGPEAASTKAAFRSIHVRIVYAGTFRGRPSSAEAPKARDDLQQRLDILSRALKQCTYLTLIRITPMYQGGRLTDRGLLRDFDKFVGCFAEIRGVGTVVFTDDRLIFKERPKHHRHPRIIAWGSKQQTERLKAIMQRPKPLASCEGWEDLSTID